MKVNKKAYVAALYFVFHIVFVFSVIASDFFANSLISYYLSCFIGVIIIFNWLFSSQKTKNLWMWITIVLTVIASPFLIMLIVVANLH